jgi:cytochrome c oxidase subunit 1
MDVNVLITVAAILGGVAQLFFLWNFFYSIFKGQKATQNPWESNTLEWSTGVKHIHGNWEGSIPTVYRGPHEYSRPDRELDYFPQYEKGEGEPEHYHAPATKVDTAYEGKKEKPSTVFFSSFAAIFMKKA